MEEKQYIDNLNTESQGLKKGIKGWQVGFIAMGGIIASCYKNNCQKDWLCA